MTADSQVRTYALDDSSGGIDEVARAADEAEGARAAIGPDRRPCRIRQQAKRQLMLGAKPMVALARLRTDPDYRDPVRDQGRVDVAQGADFAGTARCEVRRIEEQEQGATLEKFGETHGAPSLVR